MNLGVSRWTFLEVDTASVEAGVISRDSGHQEAVFWTGYNKFGSVT